MNKCCFEIFEMMMKRFKEGLSRHLIWDVKLIYKKQTLTRREFVLGPFEVVEFVKPKRNPTIFFGGSDITKNFNTKTADDAKAAVVSCILNLFKESEEGK